MQQIKKEKEKSSPFLQLKPELEGNEDRQEMHVETEIHEMQVEEHHPHEMEVEEHHPHEMKVEEHHPHELDNSAVECGREECSQARL